MNTKIEENPKTNTIGQRLTHSREKLNMKPADVVKHFELTTHSISLSMLNKYEHDKVLIGTEKLVMLCKLYGVSADYILFGKPESEFPEPLADAILNFADEIRDYREKKRI